MLIISSTVTVNNHLHSARRPSIAEVTLSLSLVVLLCSCLAWLSFFAGASVVFSSVCLSIRLPVYLYTHPSIYLSIHLFAFTSVWLSTTPAACLSVCLSPPACCLYTHPSVYPVICMSVCQLARVCLPFHQSGYSSVFLHVCLIIQPARLPVFLLVYLSINLICPPACLSINLICAPACLSLCKSWLCYKMLGTGYRCGLHGELWNRIFNCNTR